MAARKVWLEYYPLGVPSFGKQCWRNSVWKEESKHQILIWEDTRWIGVSWEACWENNWAQRPWTVFWVARPAIEHRVDRCRDCLCCQRRNRQVWWQLYRRVHDLDHRKDGDWKLSQHSRRSQENYGWKSHQNFKSFSHTNKLCKYWGIWSSINWFRCLNFCSLLSSKLKLARRESVYLLRIRHHNCSYLTFILSLPLLKAQELEKSLWRQQIYPTRISIECPKHQSCWIINREQ